MISVLRPRLSWENERRIMRDRKYRMYVIGHKCFQNWLGTASRALWQHTAPCTNSGRGVLEERGALGSSLGQVDKEKELQVQPSNPWGCLLLYADPSETNVPFWVWEPFRSHSCPSGVLVLSGLYFPSSPCSPKSYLVAGISAICLVVRGPPPVSGK